MSGVDGRTEVDLGARLVFFEATRHRRLGGRELAERLPPFGRDSFVRLCPVFHGLALQGCVGRSPVSGEGYSIFSRQKPLQLHTSSSMLLPSSTRLPDAGVTHFFRA